MGKEGVYEEEDLHRDVWSSEKLTAMLKQETSIFVALPLSSTIHTGLYTVTNTRGTASPGAWLVGVASTMGVAAKRAREIERPTSRNLVGVVLEFSAFATAECCVVHLTFMSDCARNRTSIKHTHFFHVVILIDSLERCRKLQLL